MCGKGTCRKNAESLTRAGVAQAGAQRNQVVVVHPHEIVGAQHRLKPGGELAIDAQVGRVLRVDEAELVDEVVEERPERAVAEPEVVQLVVLAREVGGRVRDSAPDREARRGGRSVDDLAAPAKPQAAAGLHRRQHADREPAGGRSLARDRDAVRHGDEPAHTRSSQLRDRRTAVLTIPTML